MLEKAIGALIVLAAAAVVTAGIAAGLMYVGRSISQSITTVEVVEPEPGVRCAKMLTTEAPPSRAGGRNEH